MSTFLQNSISYKSNYKKIVEVFIFHEYYLSRNCTTIDFVPDRESLTMIRNYNLLFKRTAQGFVLLQSVDNKTTSPSFSGLVTFGFEMIFKDVLFLNLTEMPFQYNQFISFTNKKTDRELLHEDSYVGEKDIRPFAGNGIGGKIELTLNQNNEFFGEESQTHKIYQYKVFFNARTFVMRYNFYFSTTKMEISKFYVINEKDGKRYEDFTSRQLENGIDVFSLELSDEIKLKEQYDFLLYLKKEDEFDKSLSKFLPHPEPKNLSFDSMRNLFINDLFVVLD